MNRQLLFFLVILGLLLPFASTAQEKATLYGKITDKVTNEPLIGATVILKGTKFGAVADENGSYRIAGIPKGEYTVQISFIGYETVVFTGIKLKDGDKKEISSKLGETVIAGQEVVIVGEKPLVDVENSQSTQTVTRDKIENAPARQIQEVISTQPGVVNTPGGLFIRGSRSYETGYYVDDVSAKDPLAGTGFGLDIGTNAVRDIEVTTGGAGVEYGNNTAGVVNVQTRTGGDKTEGSILYKRDNFGFNKDWKSVYNQQVGEFSLGGPIKVIPGRFTYFTSLRFNISDTYLKLAGNKLNSSIMPNDFFTPNQDNRWSGLLKLNYQVRPKMFISGTYMKTITVNQDLNMLRVTGNDVPFNPGFQYPFLEQPENANTYTHDMNMEVITLSHSVSNKFSYKVIASRLFVHLRADANGRPWRPDVVNTEFDPNSIVQFPAGYFNPDDSVVFVNSPSGFYNNNGIATLWHDHFVDEKTLQFRGYLTSKNTRNKLSFGSEFKHQSLQWIDITRPWIGAPIELANGQYSQTFRLGEISDVWRVKPITGAFYAADQVRYLGLIAEIGGRLEYWFPGKLVDEAVKDPSTPIRQEIRDEYNKQTLTIGGRHFKARFLPKISASFPIKENQVVFFNYRQSTILPHPSYVYTGLDPYYQDRSTLSFVGNPNLNPEVDISYELGLKSQITADDVLGITAYQKDKYDFITSSSIDIVDVTGREVTRTIRINSDYARTRGVEITYIKRIGRWFSGQISGSYSIATGQSASASQNLRDILNTGNREDTREYYLPWDNPVDLKFNALFTQDTKEGMFKLKALNKFRFYLEGNFRTGRRYTPYYLLGYEQYSGRPIYEEVADPSQRYSKLGTPWFWLDMNFNKWWNFKKAKLIWTLELTNVLNNKNAVIINPVTGRAYEYGDPVPSTSRDPMYNDPRDPRSSLLPMSNPARYMAPRHFLTGFIFSF